MLGALRLWLRAKDQEYTDIHRIHVGAIWILSSTACFIWIYLLPLDDDNSLKTNFLFYFHFLLSYTDRSSEMASLTTTRYVCDLGDSNKSYVYAYPLIELMRTHHEVPLYPSSIPSCPYSVAGQGFHRREALVDHLQISHLPSTIPLHFSRM